jgi:hypothetical protein
MSQAIVQRLTGELQRLLTAMPSVEAAAVVSHDGLPMASLLPDDLDEDRVGAMAAALLGLGERAGRTLGRGAAQQILVEGEHGYLCIMDVRHRALLVAVVHHVGKVGLLLYEMRAVSDGIAAILQAAAAGALPSDDAGAPPSDDAGALPADGDADDVGTPMALRHFFAGQGADTDVQGG